MKLQKPKGTQDILSHKSLPSGNMLKNLLVRHLGNTIMLKFVLYLYCEVSVVLVEMTDIVIKEMYDFYDKGDRHHASSEA